MPDAKAGSRRATLVLGGLYEAGLAEVSRSGQRRYRNCSERRSVWRETSRGKAVEGSGFGCTGGRGGSRRGYISRRLHGSVPLGSLCLPLFSEEVASIDMAKQSAESRERVVRSSGNVFADLGFADAGERQTKVRLAIAINDVLKRRGLSQVKAAELLGINQPKVSALSKYRLEGFSVERLMRFLTALNQDVEIVIRHRARTRGPGRVYVTAA